MSNSEFFDVMREQSNIKVEIVSKYFSAWAKIMVGQVKGRGNKIAYVDLFAGRGRYKDGSPSTPLLILEHAIKNEKISQTLITIFNDKDTENAEVLRREIDTFPGISNLTYQPIVYNIAVDEEITQIFEKVKQIPTLFFIDPWGYKGLSLQLINAVLKNWGCDCIFFFNYNRINMGLNNPIVIQHMEALFGEKRVAEIQKRLDKLAKSERENFILKELENALKDIGGTYVQTFSFKSDRGSKTTHHIIFVCKNELGYKIMRNIMTNASSNLQQGVPSFTYNPVEINTQVYQLSLFDRPLDTLENLLLNDFAGRSITVKDIYESHYPGTKYIEKNYKDAVLSLEAQGKIVGNVPFEKRKKRNGQPSVKDVIFTFPSKSSSSMQ